MSTTSLVESHSIKFNSGISLITIQVEGELGLNNWYTSDVDFSFTKESEDIASIYYNYAGVHMGKGDRETALQHCNKSLAIRIKLLGENHLDVAESYNGQILYAGNSGGKDSAVLDFLLKAAVLFV